jgi:hypothetical protein
MNPFIVGKQYSLRLTDGALLGRVQVERLADGWAEGQFHPGEAFPRLHALFEEESQLRRDQVIPLWEEAADRIEALQIEAVGADGDVHAPVRVYIERGEAFLAPPLPLEPEGAAADSR